MELITKNIYRIPLKLENNPLKEVFSYIITHKEQALLIDTGFNNEQTKKTLLKSLETLNINISNLRVFISHLHADHSGLAGYFDSLGCKIYASHRDASIMNNIANGQFYKNLEDRISLLDLDRHAVTKDILPQSLFSFNKSINFSILEDGDSLTIGDKILRVIDISGHTPGMIGLYDLQTNFLFSADHVLDQISPNIAYWDDDFNALHIFLSNLKKIMPLDIKKILPAHRNIMSDHPRRVLELITHHEERLDEVSKIFSNIPKALSASETAALMTWNFRAPMWDEFPAPQKFFSASEAMAHLEYLYKENKLSKSINNNIAYYSI